MSSVPLQHPPAEASQAARHFESLVHLETDCWDVHEALLAGEQDFALLDVRDAEAFALGHVPTAVNLKQSDIEAYIGNLTDRRPLIVYCTGPHCNGADKAAARIAATGHPVKKMIGGMWGWRETGLAVATGEAPGEFAGGKAMTVERLREFSTAWSRADVDTLMSMMTDDCVYMASVGPEPGKIYRGPEEVRRGFEELLAYDREARNDVGRMMVTGDIGVAEWSYEYHGDGREYTIAGIDLFEFRGDKIRVKNAFRKTFGEVATVERHLKRA